MEDTTIINTSINADAEYEAAIDGYLREMERLREEMESRQQRIEKMQAENRAALAQLEQLRAS